MPQTKNNSNERIKEVEHRQQHEPIITATLDAETGRLLEPSVQGQSSNITKPYFIEKAVGGRGRGQEEMKGIKGRLTTTKAQRRISDYFSVSSTSYAFSPFPINISKHVKKKTFILSIYTFFKTFI